MLPGKGALVSGIHQLPAQPGNCRPLRRRSAQKAVLPADMLRKLRALIGAEEEQPVLHDGPAEAAAELVALELVVTGRRRSCARSDAPLRKNSNALPCN